MSSISASQRMQEAVPAVLPSMLLCDFANLEREVRRLEDAGTAALHLDVMDGHFVPNLTYGFPLVEALRRLTPLVLDVHLMISDPLRYVPQFQESGADVITFHAEAVDAPREVLEAIREHGCAGGVAINPPTPLSTIEGCLDLCDLVLVMSVMPGFGGQAFEPVALEKLRELRRDSNHRFLLEIDGGVNEKTIGDCAAAGADLFVVGSGIFRSDDYRASISTLGQLAQSRYSVSS